MRKTPIQPLRQILNEKYLALLVLLVVSISLVTFEIEEVFGATAEWNSEISVGILQSEVSEYGTTVKVTTYSNNALLLDWQEPKLSNNFMVVGYEIFRKSFDSEYIQIIENTNSTSTAFIDQNLSPGYYGYKIIPKIEQIPSDQITMHGIDRKNNLFNSYLLGQELLAQYKLSKILNGKTIQNDSPLEFKTHHYDFLKRSEDPVLQKNISIEMLKAQKIFFEKFKITINH